MKLAGGACGGRHREWGLFAARGTENINSVQSMRRLLARPSQQLRWHHPECCGDSRDVEQRQVALAAFDFSHVRAINPCCVGERLLGHPLSLPLATDGGANLHQEIGSVIFSRRPSPHPRASPAEASEATVFTTHFVSVMIFEPVRA